MAYNVKFLKGNKAGYAALTPKDVNTFYYTTDDNQLYLGTIKLSNGDDVATALSKLGDLTTLDTTAQDTIVNAINEVVSTIGDVTGLKTTAKTEIVAAINELKAAVDANATAGEVKIEESTPDGVLKAYTVKQGTKTIGTINIPKDLVVQSGSVVDKDASNNAGTFIKLVIANQTEPLYIDVKTLVDIYTVAAGATQVQLAVTKTADGTEISAELVDLGVTTGKLANEAVTEGKIGAGAVTEAKIGAKAVTTGKIADSAVTATQLATDAVETAKIKADAVTKAKLEEAVRNTLALADSALQKADITTGSANGTIAVEGSDVAVFGLKSAAYAETTAFDAAGAATDAETNAKAYTDTALTWGSFPTSGS